MKHGVYLNAKQVLISTAKEAKRLSPRDKPMIRQEINDQADQMQRQIDFWCMKGNYSEAQARIYKAWIENLACKLHPKN